MARLGQKYQITKTEDHTKDRILLVAARLFALRGYHAVSVRDICAEVEIQAGSIYNHYTSKEDILMHIFDKYEEILTIYYSRLDFDNQQAQNLEELINNMFVELLTIANTFTFYSLMICQALQYTHERARSIYVETFILNGKQRLERQFNWAIEQGWTKPFDVEMVSILIMTNTVVGNGFQVGAFHEIYRKEDIVLWHSRCRDYVMRLIQAAV